MQRCLINRRSRDLITSLLLVALAFRAYVPMGFMPAASTPFALEICRDGAPAPAATHHQHHHGDSHTQFSRCPFGSAPATGPISHFAVPPAPGPIASVPVANFEGLRLIARFDRAHQPRAPPRLA
jgi:hypothetical protein